MEHNALFQKCVKVLDSCETLLQTQTAMEYIILARKRIMKELNIQKHDQEMFKYEFKTKMENMFRDKDLQYSALILI